MADLKVRQLDDSVADSLKARAGRKGVSTAFLRRAGAIRKAIGAKARTDSTRLIRQERDARG